MQPKPELDIQTLIKRNNDVLAVLPGPTLNGTKTKTKIDLSELDGDRITNQTSFPEPIPVLTINGSTYAVESELSIITGLPKAGKSAVIAAMIAAPFVTDTTTDTLTIVAPPVKGRNVIYIDTEMSKGSTQKLHNQVLRVLDLKHTPKNLRFWNWKKYRPDNRIERLMATFDLVPDLHIIFIDGIADFLLSVNDELRANELLEMLGVVAEEKKCSIVTVIHENFGNGQARGHIGSSLGRKCAGTISIKKDRAKGVTCIECKTLRHAADFETVYLQWNPDLMRLTTIEESLAQSLSTNAKKTEEEKQAEKRDALARLLKQSFGPNSTLPKKELINRLILYYKSDKAVTDKTASRLLKQSEDFQLVTFDPQKVYSLTAETP